MIDLIQKMCGILKADEELANEYSLLIADDSKLATSEERGEFNKTMDSEVEDGKKRAISIIIEHQTFVVELAKLLCERLILSEDELKDLKEKSK